MKNDMQHNKDEREDKLRIDSELKQDSDSVASVVSSIDSASFSISSEATEPSSDLSDSWVTSSDLSDDSVASSNLSDTSVSSDGNMELEALRSEVNELKRLLAKSRITNEKVLRNAINAKGGWLDRLVKLEIFSLPLITLILAGFSALVGASMWPIVVFFVIACISTWLDWYTLRIAPANIFDMTMMELKMNLLRQKRYRMIQTVVESVVTFLWLCWYVYSIKSVLSPDDELDNILKYTIFGGSFVGGIISVVVIVWIYKKAQNTNDELIDSIDSNYDV